VICRLMEFHPLEASWQAPVWLQRVVFGWGGLLHNTEACTVVVAPCESLCDYKKQQSGQQFYAFQQFLSFA